MHFFDLYQQLMKKTRQGVAPLSLGHTLPTKRETVQYKTYERFPLHQLPSTPALMTPLGQSLHDRRSGHSFGHTLSEVHLSQLLTYSLGEQAADVPTYHRPYPSAGGLYPLEGYVLIQKPIGPIATGLYHYDVAAHGLRTLLTKLPSPEVFAAATTESYVKQASGALVLTACFDRTAMRYGESAYKFALLEAGAALQNFTVVAAALALDTVQVGTFAEDILEPLLGIDGTHEVALQTIWFG